MILNFGRPFITKCTQNIHYTLFQPKIAELFCLHPLVLFYDAAINDQLAPIQSLFIILQMLGFRPLILNLVFVVVEQILFLQYFDLIVDHFIVYTTIFIIQQYL